MKKYNTEANTMFSEVLAKELTVTQLTKAFIEDYAKWNTYAYEQDETNKEEKEWNIGKSYDNLIRKYCGDEKEYQGLAYGNQNQDLKDNTILEEQIIEDKAVVKVKYQDPEFDFITHFYEYHFEKKSDYWQLVEKYYLDDYDNNKRLPYL